MSSWISVEEKKPPSFFTVWVMNGKRKRRAYWDGANKRWYQNKINVWSEDLYHKVTHWAIIQDNTFEDQIIENLRTHDK